MIVTINGERRELGEGTTVAAILALAGAAPGGRGVAVALDGEVVPRAAWPEVELREGARVEVLSAVQGG